MHFLIYNLICYKYNISQSKLYKFDFQRIMILASYINYNILISLKEDNILVNLWSLAKASLI